MFIAVPYKNSEEIIYINLDNVAMAQPRFAKTGGPGERKGKTYTSFLLISYVGTSPVLETLLEWGTFMEIAAPYESTWDPNQG